MEIPESKLFFFSLAYTGVNTAVVILKAIMIDKNLFNFIKNPPFF